MTLNKKRKQKERNKSSRLQVSEEVSMTLSEKRKQQVFL